MSTDPRPPAALPAIRPWRLGLTVLVGLAVWLSPPPTGVNPTAWHLLAIFLATVVGLISRPMPIGAVAVLAITTASLTRTVTVHEALDSFRSHIIWLIILTFFISRGFMKSGLSFRIAYLLIAALGRSTLGVAYALSATDLILAPAMPSNTARAGGVLYPLVLAVSQGYGSKPDAGRRKIGAFLILNSFQAVLITGALFLTAMSANLLAQKQAAGLGVAITWGDWALAASVPGAISLLTTPLILYALYPPEIRHTPGAAELAHSKLAELGPMKFAEWVMLGVFVLMLTLWVVGDRVGVDPTTTALLGLSLLLLLGVLNWDDVLAEREAWDTLVWFAALVMMAEGLARLGLIGWLSGHVAGWLGGMDWGPAFVLLVLVYFYSHYLFASNTAHVSALYASFLGVAVPMGAPPLLAALVLGFAGNLFSSMTHYGTGPAPVFFGAGYVPLGVWWGLGFLLSVIHILVWGLVGGLWWKVLGLW
jgi:DASS family divalent anion:Na+ symporter